MVREGSEEALKCAYPYNSFAFDLSGKKRKLLSARYEYPLSLGPTLFFSLPSNQHFAVVHATTNDNILIDPLGRGLQGARS